jgi:hypothetical protein
MRAVRRGEQLDTRADAKLALDAAEWMTRQAQTTYFELLSTRISIAAIVLLLAIGWWSVGHWIGAVANMLPFFGIMLVVRWAAWLIFRRAPEAHENNLAKVQRRKRP